MPRVQAASMFLFLDERKELSRFSFCHTSYHADSRSTPSSDLLCWLQYGSCLHVERILCLLFEKLANTTAVATPITITGNILAPVHNRKLTLMWCRRTPVIVMHGRLKKVPVACVANLAISAAIDVTNPMKVCHCWL